MTDTRTLEADIATGKPVLLGPGQRRSSLAVAGTELTSVNSTEEALKQANLAGWDVRFEPLQGAYTRVQPNDGQRMVIRTNPQTQAPEYLGIVGGRYKIHQIEEHAAFLDAVLFESGGHYASATALRNNTLVYLSIELPQHLLVGGLDPVRLYLNGINSFNGQSSFMLSLDAMRGECANQLNYWRSKDKGIVRYRHTSSLKGRVEQARQALEISLKMVDELAADAERLASRDMTVATFQSIIDKLYPAPKVNKSVSYDTKRDVLTALFTGGTNAAISYTAWAGLNAVLEYEEHYKPVQGQSKMGAHELANARAERSLADAFADRFREKAYETFANPLSLLAA